LKRDFHLGLDFPGLAHVLVRRRGHSSVDHAALEDGRRQKPGELAEEVVAEGTKIPGNS
jgi:hypothetical protein